VRIEKLKRRYDISVRFVHFPLHPETPAAGISLDALFGGRPDDEARKARQARMKALMDAEGLPYGARTHSYNSRLAQELGKWAETQEGGEAIHDALFRAYFVDGRNIGDPAILVEIAQSVGLPAQGASRVLAERSFKDAVDEDWRTSREAGVTGVPTFASAGRGVVGAQAYEVLENLIATAGAQPRKSNQQ
jgi:predicted DsbA family dithiol-disulfide isomerase